MWYRETKEASRKYVDLMWYKTTKFANWDPSKKIQIGDYGLIDKETGVFEPEGNIYDEPTIIPSGLHARETDIVQGDPIESYIACTGRQISREAHFGAEVALSGVAQASIKGDWDFGRKRGAALVMYNARMSSLPGPRLKTVAASPILEDKCVVTEVYTCTAYCLYLSNEKQDRLRVEFRAPPAVPVAAGVTAGGSVGFGWQKEHRGGLYHDALHSQGEHTYYPLFNLKKQGKTISRRDSPEPESPGIDDVLWTDAPVPWDMLDEYGNEFGVDDSD
ncbi:hypothetical protein BV25DRAFT_1853802 [Artomyces pyxidatus]|uniref:Uncharacterized protein n=1 Tax=Artomyces pyxidatus TaxID=48021 RepID=A0ACB8T591_9AGAM|nr:hypothetical protein BV25DRAFT_1853802 [Artomyces pyxidatus]